MNHLVVMAVLAAATGIKAQSTTSFGVTVATNQGADTPATVSVSLWNGGSLYQCSYGGMSKGATYSCSSATWTESGTACDSSSAGYKLLIENANSNAVNFDAVFLTVDGLEYTYDAWCTSNDWQPFNNHDIEYSPSSCQDGYVNYDIISFDSDQSDTTAAMFHLKLTNPGETSYDALMEDAADICVVPNGCDCQTVCAEADMVNVDWHDMLNENVPSPSLLHSEAIAFEASSMSLSFSASLEYIGKSADGNFDDDFDLGTTYWIDFESFSSGADNIRSPGTCGNRQSADISGPDFADLWTFPVNPADLDSATTADRMAYPPSGWTLNAVNCTTIKYSRTLSWADLTSCQDAAGNALISVENTNEALKLSGTFFVELISPYSMSTEGYFRTFPLVQRDFQIVLNKQLNVMASTGVQLFIPSVMAINRHDDGDYEVTVLIQSADYVSMSLDDVAAVTGPLTISGVETVAADCLVASSFTCGQIFTAKIDASCPDDGSVDLSGSYQFAFTPQCIVLEDGSTDPACEAFKTTLDAAGKVALGVDVSFIDQCDVDLFDVSFNGTLSFYSDDQFAVAVDGNSDPFVIGQDTIFGKVTVSMANPAVNYQLSGVTIETVYVCTAANALSDISANGAGGCLSAGIIDADGPHNVIGVGAVPEYLGTVITSTESDEGRFSFLTFDTARDTIYVHVQALLDVTFTTGRRRRVRMLLQSDGAEANQFRSFVGTASVVEAEETDDVGPTDGGDRCSAGLVVAMMVFAAAMMD